MGAAVTLDEIRQTLNKLRETGPLSTTARGLMCMSRTFECWLIAQFPWVVMVWQQIVDDCRIVSTKGLTI